MSDRTFFDTNVLVYIFDTDSPAKQARARDLLTEHARFGRIVLSSQVLQEFYVTVIRKLARPLPVEEALAALVHLSSFPLITSDGALILRAVQLHQKASLSFWDALIVQAALESNCRRLLSEDLQHGRRFGGLLIENPFAE
ncbi:MAG: PIN domain-containing protein [Thermoanaerobaculia bacterium]